MKAVLGCTGTFIYFSVMGIMMLGVVLGNHCAGGPCLTDGQLRFRILLIFFGGFAIWFAAAFCFWWFVERHRNSDEDF